jgi:hypothetical protein
VTPKAFPLPPKLTVTALHGGEASGGYTTRRVRPVGAGGAGAAPWPVRAVLGGAGPGGGPGGVGAGDPGGVRGAAERLGVDKATLYLAWRRWGWGGRPTGPRVLSTRDDRLGRSALWTLNNWRSRVWTPPAGRMDSRGKQR